MTQISLYEGAEPLRITKPIRLIECFAGIGAQAKALEILGVPFEHYRICEFDKFAVASYNAVHGTDFKVSDITQIHAENLGVCDTDKYTYILTYSFPCTDLSTAGKGAGMAKGSGTRSGLLWEVERLLNEMDELPQILLMDFDDEDFDRAAAVNSKTQLLKQAGNSIVVNCLVAIFGQMIEGKENVYKERKEPKP